MIARSTATIILGLALLLGILGDFLLRPEGPTGLTLVLWAAALVVAVLILERRVGGVLSREARVWYGVGIAFTATMVWRAAPGLVLIAFLSAATAFALPVYRAGAAWVRGSGLLHYAGALVWAPIRAGLNGVMVLTDVDWGSLRSGSGRSSWRRAAAVARGVAIAVPFLLVFGGLFFAADAVFANLVSERLRIDFELVASHLLLIGFFGWLGAGYLRSVLTGTEVPTPRGWLPPRPRLGITEVGVALGLVDLLFLLFVLIQLRYLFGGASLVEVTPELGYADYARRGFFELLAVAILALPLLLSANWILQRDDARDERIFRAAAGVQVFLVLAVMASAVERLRLYQDAYGLTSSRFYAAVVLGWLALLFLWFVATVLRGHTRHFAFGTLVSALVTAAVLIVVNPDAIVVRGNAARAAAGEEFDAGYALSLSTDASPALVAALDDLPELERCRVAQGLIERASGDLRADWRVWTWSRSRAIAAIEESMPRLRLAADAPRLRIPCQEFER